MIYLRITLFSWLLVIATLGHTQCNTNTTICTPGTAGPFNFIDSDAPVSTCLDFINGSGAGVPNYAFILLYITSTGPLEMLITGDNTGGFLDVAVFNIPSGVPPCTAIQNNANEISCNYASNFDGCAEFGSWTAACNSEVVSPMVTAGDVLMIVVEDWDNIMNSFTLDLSGNAGAAGTGPPDATITNPGVVNNQTPPFNMTAVDNGGTWSADCGICIDPVTGEFDPAVAGPGLHTVSYTIGSPPCDDQDVQIVNVQFNPLPVSFGDMTINCVQEGYLLEWNTWNELNNDYFLIEASADGEDFREIGTVDGNGSTNNSNNYSYSVSDYYRYFRLSQVDFDGSSEELKTIINNCSSNRQGISPNPFSTTLSIIDENATKGNTNVRIYSATGTEIFPTICVLNGMITIDTHELNPGLYHVVTVINEEISTYKAIKR